MAEAALTFVLKAKDEASRVVGAVTSRVTDDVQALDSAAGRLAQSFGLSDTKAATFAKTLPIIGAGAAAVGGAALAAGAAVFALAKQASDSGSEIYEFAQRTNLSAEFLSVLKVQAEQSGSSLSSAAGSATKFTNSLVDAARGNEDLIKILKRFGIDAAEAYRNPEATLKAFIERFNQLPPTAANNEAAMKLFKDRTGEIVPVIRAFGDDYGELVRKLDASGQIWTQEGTEKADAFGDALTELGQTATGIGNVFAREVMPDITDAMKEITKSVTENKDAFREWGRSTGDVIRGTREVLDSNGGAILSWIGRIAAELNPVGAVILRLRDIGAGTRGTAEPSSSDPGRRFGGMANAPAAGQTPTIPTLAPADVTNEAEAKKAEAEGKRRRAEAEREAERQANVVKRLADAYAHLSLQVEHFNDTEVEQQIATMRLNSGVETLTGTRRKEAELLLAINAVEMRTLDVKEQIRAAQAQAKKDEEELRDLRINVSEKVREELHAQLEALVGQETQLEKVNRLIRGAEIVGAIDAQTAAWLRATAAVNDYDAGVAKTGLSAPAGNTAQIPQGAGPWVDPKGNAPAPEGAFSGDIFQEWGTKVGEVFGVVGEQARGVGEIISSSFGMMAQAAGGAIKAFVLFGSAGGSFRKFAAEVVASIASMAIVQAVWEVAQGLAMLALAWFTGNPKYGQSAGGHFAAAAMYGTIGGVAAIAGRALAGNSFASLAGGGGGAGGGAEVNSYEDNRTKYMREQAERDRGTRREDRREEARFEVPVYLDGRELARGLVRVVRDGGDVRSGFKDALGMAT
jgi:hypothetical protein